MTDTYKRKRINNLDDLDREEARLRKKSKRIEQDWEEMLDPQQLLIDFASSFLGKKIRNGFRSKKEQPSISTAKQAVYLSPGIKQKKKSTFFKKVIKGSAIAVVAFIAVKKIMEMRRKPTTVVVRN